MKEQVEMSVFSLGVTTDNWTSQNTLNSTIE